MIIRLINLDEIGRKFAQKKNANVLILSSSCRTKMTDYSSFIPDIPNEELEKHGL